MKTGIKHAACKGACLVLVAVLCAGLFAGCLRQKATPVSSTAPVSIAVPAGMADPAEALNDAVLAFWDSETVQTVLFNAFYKSASSSEDLNNFNRVNASNIKGRMMTDFSFEPEIVELDEAAGMARVRLKVTGVDFKSYVTTLVAELEKVAIASAQAGADMDALTRQLQTLPYEVLGYSAVRPRASERIFHLSYVDGAWEVLETELNDEVLLGMFLYGFKDVVSSGFFVPSGRGPQAAV